MDSISSDDSHDSMEEDIPVNIQIPILDSDDLTMKQKKRRMRRMEILRRKRRGSYDSSASSTKVVKASSSRRSSTENITDPKLLRKLRNREAAERSRKRITDTIDALTFQVCEHYVILQDLEQQYDTAMLGILSPSSSFASPSSIHTFSSHDGSASPVLSDLTDDDYSCLDSMPVHHDLIDGDLVQYCGQVHLDGQDFDRSLNEVLDLFLFA